MDALEEKELPEEEVFVDTPMPEETAPEEAPKKRRIRAEWIMAIIAGLAAVLLGVIFLLSYPHMNVSEDPEALPQRHEDIHATEPVRETLPAPADPEETAPETAPEETEPEFTTVPPDKNPYDRYDFQYNEHNYLLLQNVDSSPGVDVSAYQGVIDWEQVAASGIEFAIIRLGYRGYESGKLVEDKYALDNLDGAAAAGLKVGAYFFSQALSNEEVDAEIEFMLELLGDRQLDMPVVLDWEIPAANARTARMDARTLTNMQLHFCKIMEQKGYRPMVYFNWHQAENLYYLHELEEFPFWLALYQDRMTFPWKVEMWQYTASGKVPGIAGDVDINVYMPY